ncbi:hypothetical protein HID58_037916 [Brassica napus]|uniref:Uncharacterized protein n=1 Tax=Brassica napus TaxID=3708 RepID=A0ABQ8BMU1_BRANA|nr:hypothetical protein HID58_037916 [Brassica napus]
MEIARNLREGEKRKLKESGGDIGRIEIENPRNTLHASRGKPRVNTNLEIKKRGTSIFPAKILDQNPLAVSPVQGTS